MLSGSTLIWKNSLNRNLQYLEGVALSTLVNAVHFS